MRKFLLLFCLILLNLLVLAQTKPNGTKGGGQQGFSFSCTRDTLLFCGPPCITLKAKIPEIKSLTSSYSVNPVQDNGGCRIPVDPEAPGNPTNFTDDDKYSSVIDIGFPFPFFGNTYTQLVASTNGYISFDISKANLSSHFTVSANLPTTSYDKALIMGPYHDLDPSSRSNPPSTMKIKYDLLGTAPNRRWVFSFYNVPLYSTVASTCGVLNQNSHQIVLYESTGIIEIVITSKQICTGWQSGKSIVGIQNFNRDLGLMAPNRRASDPPWGTVGMNEVWRFVPDNGPSLFRRVELFDMAGTLVSTGTVTANLNNELEVDFPNVCYTANTTNTYIVKATYTKIDAPAEEVSAFDTVNVISQNILPATGVVTPASCGGANGAITVNVASGSGQAPFQYSINTGPLQSSNSFTNLSAGTYNIYAVDALGCNRSFQVVVTAATTISGTASTSAASCPGVNNGTITITPTSGAGPYQYSLNSGPNQLSNVFSNLAPATYNITFTDINNCSGALSVTVAAGAAITATTSSNDAACAGVNNGTITVTPTSGNAPYRYSADAGPFQLSNTLTGLAPGNHNITFQDVNGCSSSMIVFVGVGSGIVSTNVVTPPSCAGASNGSITINPTNGSAPYSYSLNSGPTQLSNSFTGLAANTYSVLITDALGCTGTANIVMPGGAGGLTANTVLTGTSCPGVNNGAITINPTNGLAPYQYSLNTGPFQLSNTFTNLAAGTYTVNIKDAINCSGTLSVTVAAGVNLVATSSVVNPPCSGINNGSITITPSTGTAPYLYSLNTGPFTPVNTFNGLAAPATYTINFSDAIGCTGTISVPLVANTAISTTIAIQMPLCFGDANGNVTFSPAGGVAPFQFSKDAGVNYQASNTFTGLTMGTYNFRIKDNLGCTKDSIVTLTQPTLLTAAAASTPSTCNGNDGVITLTGGGGTTGYLYSIDNGINYQAANTFNVAPGNYNNMLIKDANGCTKPAGTVVTLVDNMSLSAGADTTVCIGSGVTLQPITNTGTSIFNWSPAAGLSNASIKNPVASPTDTTSYYLDATWGLCNRKDTIVVRVLHKPVAHAGNDTAICYKTTAFLHGSATNLSGGVTYAWSPAGMALNPTSANTTVRPDNSQLFTLTVKDTYGCNFSVTDDIFVTMQPIVPAHAGNDTIAVYGVPFQLASSGGVSYLWSPASVLNNPFAQNPLATLTNDTYLNVQVTDVAGCIGNDGLFVKVYRGPTYYMPNAFSPNGDGLNEKFRPTPVGIKSTEFFRVFNRYGQLLFETTKWMDGWDGKYQGKPQQTGAYVWVIKGIDKDGKVVEMKGQVILMR